MRLRELDWGDADLTLERTPKMTLAHSQFLGQLRDAVAVQSTSSDSVGGFPREPGDRIDDRSARRELRAAPKAWPVARLLGGCRTVEEPSTIRMRDARGTNGPAVDARGRDPNEKHSIESRIPRGESPRVVDRAQARHRGRTPAHASEI